MATGGGNSFAGGGAGAKGMTDQTPAKRKEIAKSAQKYIEETFNHSDKPKPPPYAAVAAERRSGEATSGTKRPTLSREEQRRKAREWAEKTLKGQAGSAAAERGDSGGESPPLKKRHTAQQPHSDAARTEAAAAERRRAREWADANVKGKKRAYSPPPQQQQRRARPLEGEDSIDVDDDSDAERCHRRRHEASMKLEEEEEEEEDEEEGFHSSTDAGEREPPRKAPRRHPPLLPPPQLPQPQQPQWQQPAAAPAPWETPSSRSAVAGAVGSAGSGAGGGGGGADFAGSVSAAGGSSRVGGGAAGRGGTGISRHAVDGSSSSSGAFYPARLPPAAPQGLVPPRMPMPPLPIASTTPQQQQHQRHSYGGSGAGGRYGVMYGAGDDGIGYGGGGSAGGGGGGGRRSLSPPRGGGGRRSLSPPRGRLAQFVQEQEQGESPPGARVPVSGGSGGGGGAWLAEGAEGDGGRADEGVAAALGEAGGGSAAAGRRRRAPLPPPPAAPPVARPIAQLAATQQRQSRRARLATAALALAAAALVVALAGWGLVLVAPRCWATASVALAQLWSRAHAALQYGGRVCYGEPPGGVEEGVCREWRPCPRAGQCVGGRLVGCEAHFIKHGDACALEPRLRGEAERARNFLRKSVEAHLCSGAPPPRLPLPPSPAEASDADGDAAACAAADARVLPALLRRGLLDDTFTILGGGVEFALSEREEQLVPLPLGCAIKRGATAFAKERQRELGLAFAALLFLLWVDGKRRARYRRIVLATKLRNAAYRYLVEHARDVEDKPVPVSHIQAHALERVGLSAASSRVRTRALTDAWPWVQRKVDKDPRVRLVFANVRGQHNVPAWCWTAADRREEAVLPLPIPEPPRLLFLRA